MSVSGHIPYSSPSSVTTGGESCVSIVNKDTGCEREKKKNFAQADTSASFISESPAVVGGFSSIAPSSSEASSGSGFAVDDRCRSSSLSSPLSTGRVVLKNSGPLLDRPLAGAEDAVAPLSGRATEGSGCLLPVAFVGMNWWEGPAPATVVEGFLPLPFGREAAHSASVV
jgi:hypothetical protein